MSVNHYLLPINDDELASILQTPMSVRELVGRRDADITPLGKDGIAIVSLTADGANDPLNFIRSGAPDDVSGWVGTYDPHGGPDACEVDMGYGPASYYRNRFLRKVAEKLEPITVKEFAAMYPPDWLEDNGVYPGGWHAEGRGAELAESFDNYRTCVLKTARSGQHLLVWVS